MEKVFVVIIASFNLPCYETMVRIRIAQMLKRNIRFHFLINGPVPEGILIPNTYTVFPELSVTKHGGDMSKASVWATLAFQQFLQSFYSEEAACQYDYILRLNVSTFVNFENIRWMLQYLPNERLLAGPLFMEGDRAFCQGTAMLFSKDVARAFAFETKVAEDLLLLNDDLAISFSLMDRYTPHDINFFYRWIERYTEPHHIQQFFLEHKYQHIFFRVKSDHNRNTMDPLIWSLLYQIFG